MNICFEICHFCFGLFVEAVRELRRKFKYAGGVRAAHGVYAGGTLPTHEGATRRMEMAHGSMAGAAETHGGGSGRGSG